MSVGFSRLVRRVATSWDFLITILLGMLPIQWADIGKIAKSEDFILPMDWNQWLDLFSTWSYRSNFGVAPDDRLPAVFFFFWPALFRTIGFSVETAQRLQFVTWYMLAGLGMYFLMTQITGKKLARAAAVFVYMLNFYQEPMWQGVNIANLSSYAALPVLVGITFWSFKTRRPIRGALAFGATSIIASGLGVNPPMLLTSLIPVPLAIVGYVMLSARQKDWAGCRIALMFSCAALAFTALVNAYWWFPQAVALVGPGAQHVFVMAGTQEHSFSHLKSLSKATTPVHVMGMQGAWVWYEGWKGVPYVPYAPEILSVPLKMVAALIPFILGLIAVSGTKRAVLLYFGSLVLLGMFISSGLNGPGGPVFRWLWDNVPAFWVIRSPWYKATGIMLLGLAPLVGFGLVAVSSQVNSMLRKTFGEYSILPKFGRGCAVIVIGMMYAYVQLPIAYGEFFVIRPSSSPLPSQQVVLPSYLTTALDWIKQQDAPRILTLPPARRMTTDWGFTSYSPAVSEFTDIPFVNLLEPSQASVANYAALLGSYGGSGLTVLQQSGISLVMQQNDVNRRYFNVSKDRPTDPGPLLLASGLEQYPSIGPIDFYGVPSPRPLVWGTKSVIVANTGLAGLAPTSEFASLTDGAVVLAPRNDVSAVQHLIKHEDDALSVVQVNPTDELYLNTIAATDAVILERNSNALVLRLGGPGEYEIWQKTVPLDLSLLTPEERLYYAFNNTIDPDVGWANVTVDGTPVVQPTLYDIATANTWAKVAEFETLNAEVTLGLPDPTLVTRDVTLVVVPRDLRRTSSTLGANVTEGASWLSFSDYSGSDVYDADVELPVELHHGWMAADSNSMTDIRRVTTAQKQLRHLYVDNPTDEIMKVAVGMSVRSVSGTRQLWVRTEDEVVGIYGIPEGRFRDILMPGVVLNPGRNYLLLYSPNPETEISPGVYASLEFQLPFRAGFLRRTRNFATSVPGRYQVILVPDVRIPSGGLPPANVVINGVDITDTIERTGRANLFSATVHLSEGDHLVEIIQPHGSRIPVLLGGPVLNPNAASANLAIDFERISNTHIRATADSKDPYVLIFNELFDPRWEARVNGAPVSQHFEVSGFANGFLIEDFAEGVHEIELTFNHQRLADISLLASVLAWLAMVGASLYFALPRKVRGDAL